MTRALIPTLLALVLVAGTLIPTQVFEALPVSAAAVDTAGSGVDKSEPVTTMKVCMAPAAGSARCHARVRTDSSAKGKAPARAATPAAGTLGNGGADDPGYLQSAYNLANAATSAGAGQTVAIVDAYDAPNAESDLNYYRSWFGRPACTTANGCFRKAIRAALLGRIRA